MRIANLIFAALFVFGAIVQFNDPDPAGWVVIYLAAAGACIYAVRQPKNHIPPMLVGLVCLIWAGILSPHVFGHSSFGAMFESWEMKDTNVEFSREMYGLLVIAAWMFLLAIRGFRMRQTGVSTES